LFSFLLFPLLLLLTSGSKWQLIFILFLFFIFSVTAHLWQQMAEACCDEDPLFSFPSFFIFYFLFLSFSVTAHLWKQMAEACCEEDAC